MGSPPTPAAPAAKIRAARGPRAVEALLFRVIKSHLDATQKDPALLARPVRVVVPSQSLRLHVAGALVRYLGRPALGITIQSLYGVAAEIVERSGQSAPSGGALFPIFVRRASRKEEILRAALDDLQDGYATVTGSVSDLIDAGLDPSQLNALQRCLDAHGGDGAQAERARAILRVSAHVARSMKEGGLGRPSTLYSLARAHLDRDPVGVLPARAILIHGFADATGAATSLIEGLLDRENAAVFLDQPPDPAGTGQADPGVAFTRRFLERLKRFGLQELGGGPEEAPPEITFMRAPGAHAEVREVANRIRNLLDRGEKPEGIALVTRQPGAYRIPIRLHLSRLGIPFSAPGIPGPTGPLERKAHALLDLLADQEDAPADRWLDCTPAGAFTNGAGIDGATDADLRLAIHAQGLARVRDVADLDVKALLQNARALPLPVRRGLWADETGGENEGSRIAPRRKLPGSVLRLAVKAASALSNRWVKWPAEAPIAKHFSLLHAMLSRDLAWGTQGGDVHRIHEDLHAIEAHLPGAFVIAYDEFLLLLQAELGALRTVPFGGEGAGVQVLSVVQARGRTFEHCFLLGMNRDVFPRTILEDPLLPDAMRRELLPLLPDIPIKERGFDEERYLFSSLLSSSPHVTISRQEVTDDGKAKPPSPLLVGLALARSESEPPVAPSLQGLPNEGGGSLLRPAHEQAMLAGLHGSRAQFAPIFQEALKESRAEFSEAVTSIDAPEIARGRMAVLDELDPDLGTPGGEERFRALGPYYGFIGSAAGSHGLRERTPFVTNIESMAACPWRTLLAKTLRVEPPPDALEVLPEIDAGLIGRVVHRTLERVAGAPLSEGRDRLEDALRLGPVPVPWPGDAFVESALLKAAKEILHGEGIGFDGLARVLARMTRPYLESAKQLDWAEPGSVLQILGVEIEGEATITDAAGSPRTVRFRADRIDLDGGRLKLTDYKAGKKVISTLKTDSLRLRDFIEAVRRGEKLQAVAYVMGAPSGEAVGRYLFLHPETPAYARTFEVEAGDSSFIRAFEEAVHAALGAWDAGSFFPRLLKPGEEGEPGACEYCGVREACLRGDTSAARRLETWTSREGGDGRRDTSKTSAEGAVRTLWRLHEKRKESRKNEVPEARGSA